MWIAETISRLLLAYLACGLLFGSAFIIVGAGKVDPAARGTSVLFRLLILPGTVALWPLLAIQWIKACRQGATP
jgi:hypothetical protein